MLDIKWIREQPAALDEALRRRGQSPRSVEILAADKARRDVQTRMQELQSERNRLSKEIGAAKSKKQDASALMARVAALKDDTQKLEEQERIAAKTVDDLLAVVPNAPDAAVPEGRDETANREVRRVGTPRTLSFQPKEHAEIGTALGLMDFDAAARMSGARFVILKGAMARLERALAGFMLDLQTTVHGYSETNVPHLVRDDALFGTGQLPKFEADLFATRYYGPDEVRRAIDTIQGRINADLGHMGLGLDQVWEVANKRFSELWAEELDRGTHAARKWLIPTAEVSLTNLVREQIVEESALPMRLTAYTPCYRSEAGAAGKDTTGMIRQHQFTKVELVSITRPEDSDAEHERMTQCAEEVLKRL